VDDDEQSKISSGVLAGGFFIYRSAADAAGSGTEVCTKEL
jgi:hypothetical protein